MEQIAALIANKLDNVHLLLDDRAASAITGSESANARIC